MFSISPDILFLGFIAGFILYRLFSVLGKKDDDGNVSALKKDVNISEMIDISSTAREEAIQDLSVIEKDMAPGFEKVLEQIRLLDHNFSLQKFLDGAKQAFDMVLTAFAKNDRDTLKDLLGDNTYKQFTREIDARLKNKVTLDLTLVALPVVKITNISFQNNKVSIDVFYESQQINILRNDKRDIIEGSLSQIDHMEDTWTFEKTLNSRDTWKLVKVNAS